MALGQRIDQLADGQEKLRQENAELKRQLNDTRAVGAAVCGAVAAFAARQNHKDFAITRASEPGSRCRNATLQPPFVAADGMSIELSACGGSLSLSSGQCTVDPCELDI